jgi:AcrR family transcriptional regulator
VNLEPAINLAGQRLGRKGANTRARILEAAREVIGEGAADGLTLSAVARRAELRMSSLYNYFSDLPDLLLALLEPVVEESETAYVAQLRAYWPDAELAARCDAFVRAFHAFWSENADLLSLRNAYADNHEQRMMMQRIDMARMVIRLLGQQMGAPDTRITGEEYDFASVLYTGLERVVIISTDDRFKANYEPSIRSRYDGKTLGQQARLLHLAIADERKTQGNQR